MKTYNIYDAKSHFSEIINEVLAGEEVTVAKAGKPVIDLKPHTPKNKPIKLGVWYHKHKPNAYDSDDIVGSDPDLLADFEASINKPFPE
jgi:prevent-host-death family protein